jgi:hypothetical protein
MFLKSCIYFCAILLCISAEAGAYESCISFREQQAIVSCIEHVSAKTKRDSGRLFTRILSDFHHTDTFKTSPMAGILSFGFFNISLNKLCRACGFMYEAEVFPDIY